MEPTTQAPLVLGLLALLVLVLVGRSVSRRRAQRAAAQSESAAIPSAAQQPEAESLPEPMVVVEVP